MAEIIKTYLPITTSSKGHADNGLSVDRLLSSESGPVVCCWNGRPVLRKEWPDLIITDTDTIIIICLPQGGGGGGSDPLKIALMIGLMAVALYVPGAMFAAGKFGTALLTAGIMMGGSALINAVLPDKATGLDSNSAVGLSQSTTYSLSSPTNASRLGDVIPVQYGRVRTTPPLITQPWAEFIDDEQYAYILLCLGQGEYELESVTFDTIASTAMKDATVTLIPPGETVPYHDNVYTSPLVNGQQIHPESNKTYNELWEYGWNQQTLLGDTWPPNPDWAWGTTFFTPPYGQDNSWMFQSSNNSPHFSPFFAIGDMIRFPQSALNTGTYQVLAIHSTYWVDDIIPGNIIGDGWYMTLTPLLQPESYNGYITLAGDAKAPFFVPSWYEGGPVPWGRPVHYDIVWPNGVYHADSNGLTSAITVVYEVLSQGVSWNGTLGAPTVMDSFTITENTRIAIRRSYTFTLPTSTTLKYFVSIRKQSGQAESTYRIDACYWAGLRVDGVPVGAYVDVSTIAIKAMASSGLSNDVLSKIRVTSTRKLPIWNGTSWESAVATRSIAWAAADACKNNNYSIGLTDANLDLDALLALDDIWAFRGDRCDGVFDTKASFWDDLQAILKTGRAQPHNIGGTITFTRDSAQLIIKGVFGVRNIVRGSFSIDYLMYDPDTPDDVKVEYLDSGTWTWKTVTCSLPGSSSEAPASLKKWGITEEAQATREGKYEAACNMYRRTFVTFQTELDARIIKRGDLVSVSHPLPSWGISGEITGINGQILALSEPVTFTLGDHYITFRRSNGTQDGPYLCTHGVDDTHVVLSDTVPSHVTSDINAGRTHFQFGQGDSYQRQCLVISARPRSGSKVELLCVVENDAVHTVDGINGGGV